jgi:hypothetical protein
VRRPIALALAAVAMSAIALAGGDSFQTTVESMQRVSATHHKLIVLTTAMSDVPSRVVLHLHYRPLAFRFSKPQSVTRANYDECIARIRSHFEEGEAFRLGVMGAGLLPVEGVVGEYLSNGLALEEEFNGDKACYSYAKPT